MKEYKNGVCRELTEEEIKEMENLPQMPTESERIEALEMAMLDLLEVMANG